MSTIQLLIDEEGNREAVRALLEDRYDVDPAGPVRDVDLYLVDDRSLPNYHDSLEERVENAQPVFCPVGLIRRAHSEHRISLPHPDEVEGPLLVDDVVDAPIDRTRLYRRVNTLLVRRRQSMDLMDSMRKLEESNRALEQFAYAASHDLQEPLRMVSSYLRLLERRYGEVLDEDGEEFLAYAKDGADRMRDMIEGLLGYSRVDSAGDPLQPTDLEGVVDDVLADLRMKIEDHDAEIDVGALPRVRGDPDQLRQLLQNLVSNAVEYSGEGDARVEITAERRSSEDVPSGHPVDGPSAELTREMDSAEGIDESEDLWVISVSDDGVGIPEED